jgi:tripartite-type tricarboxylate transporter receptor subunit TctC
MRRHGFGCSPWLAALALVAILLPAVCAVDAAETYPSKPIRLLVPYGPGGIGDLTARVVAEKMGENMGQRIVIENRPSAGMTVSGEMAMRGPADGYTILHGGNGTAISASLFKSLPYDILKDFTQLSALAAFDLLVLVAADSKFGSLGDLMAFAKSNPGKLTIGTVSVGSTQHLSSELFKSMFKIDAVVVPYKDTPGLIVSLRAKTVDLAFEFVPAVLSQIQNKTVRALAIAANKRFVGLPDVPTTAESGFPAFRVSGWNMYNVKNGTPRPIIDRLNKEIIDALKSPDVVQKLRTLGAEPWPMTTEEARAHMTSEVGRWKGVIESAKIERR